MFENIIGYDDLIQYLKSLVGENKLPSVMLFSGEPFSGKQTIAIELSRIILCKRDKLWDCSCEHCKHSRILSHQDVIFAGKTQALNEIHYAQTLLNKYNTKREAYFFIRALSKLLRRADGLLWEGSEFWVRSIRSPSEQFREHFIQYQDNPENFYNTKMINTLVESAQKLHAVFPTQMLPVQCIRNIISWSNIRSSSGSKLVIINEIESMLASSSNMLLKTLEEPPDNVYFILLSNNINAVLPTLKSRSRCISLPHRSSKIINELIQKVFKYQEAENNLHSFTSIKEFLDRYSNEAIQRNKKDIHDDNQIQNIASLYFQSFVDAKPYTSELIQGEKKTQAKAFRDFALILLYYLTINIRELLFQQHISSLRVKALWSLCEAARMDIQNRNISPGLVLEMYYYKFLEEYKKIQ